MDEILVVGERYGWIVLVLIFLVARAWPWLTKTHSTRETRLFELEMDERKAERTERERTLKVLEGFEQTLQQLQVGMTALVARIDQDFREDMAERKALQEERRQMIEALTKLTDRMHDLGIALTAVSTRMEHLERHAETTNRTLTSLSSRVLEDDQCPISFNGTHDRKRKEGSNG